MCILLLFFSLSYCNVQTNLIKKCITDYRFISLYSMVLSMKPARGINELLMNVFPRYLPSALLLLKIQSFNIMAVQREKDCVQTIPDNLRDFWYRVRSRHYKVWERYIRNKEYGRLQFFMINTAVERDADVKILETNWTVLIINSMTHKKKLMYFIHILFPLFIFSR